MSTLCFILGDQLTHSLHALQGLDKQNDVVFLCEVMEEATYVRHHPQKIAFLFSAMRHFAEELKTDGYRVRYVQLDDPANTGTFDNELKRAVIEEKATRLVLTRPGEWRVWQKFSAWKKELPLPVKVFKDNRFLCSIQDFKSWAQGRKQLRMEYFYRDMRKRYQLLMGTGNQPEGGQWNYDTDNRKRLKQPPDLPQRLIHENDDTTRSVLNLVKNRFQDHFGTLNAFNMAVTRAQALEEAYYFIDHYLPAFGPYQDAMMTGEATLYHSKLSAYLNAGLLLPLELCQWVEKAYLDRKVALNTAEGFIRQVLGWREFVRGVYWLHMPDYAGLNYLEAKRPLPSFYWGGPTRMHCLSEVVSHTREYAYSHHIQRLMVTGNFALLAGLKPEDVCAWYLAVYADAYEWVELPNTLGMALFADGGIMASKPYAASGKYIQRMSNFCQSCAYDPNDTVGQTACPFNSLYWNFLHTHRQKLQKNPRLHYAYMNWEKLPNEKQTAILSQAEQYLRQLADDAL
ncbi:cryptochrome/photolyase family protein [Legionella taurinensis]|uniref:Cryptochrome/photolyase family protein n=1 Tax=Legionella taurinensis TaxID=70611 RepID=A0A3A5L8W6_9GAMM|nr:cryptochrome/photolyase family protein [Legionella taurinensis]RJT46998.1 cryptochrome/photolyase family protein [Legionella taurinensis]RJT66800.1 cryptochrome/photolyase family protein [Legionella taurinensis]STY25486.1 deoxyribodipyrimidine photolyase-related protein [Legionella taurinensis]